MGGSWGRDQSEWETRRRGRADQATEETEGGDGRAGRDEVKEWKEEEPPKGKKGIGPASEAQREDVQDQEARGETGVCLQHQPCACCALACNSVAAASV